MNYVCNGWCFLVDSNIDRVNIRVFLVDDCINC